MDQVIRLSVFGLIAIYVVTSPYTKVEETFNLQATHDILNEGVINLANYDQFKHPGVVPRTFIGALALSGLSYPVIKLALPLHAVVTAEWNLLYIATFIITSHYVYQIAANLIQSKLFRITDSSISPEPKSEGRNHGLRDNVVMPTITLVLWATVVLTALTVLELMLSTYSPNRSLSAVNFDGRISLGVVLAVGYVSYHKYIRKRLSQSRIFSSSILLPAVLTALFVCFGLYFNTYNHLPDVARNPQQSNGITKFIQQYIVRIILGFAVASSYIFVSKIAGLIFDQRIANKYLILTLSQFHGMFWVSRTLPNTFAFILTNYAFGFFLRSHFRISPGHNPRSDYVKSIFLFVFATAVFRSEIAALLVPLYLTELSLRRVKFSWLLKTGVTCGLISIATTTLVDSYFYRTPIYPELQVFLFNTYHNQSHRWGVSPFHSYFTEHLPKLLMAALPLAMYAICKGSSNRGLRIDSNLSLVNASSVDGVVSKFKNSNENVSGGETGTNILKTAKTGPEMSQVSQQTAIVRKLAFVASCFVMLYSFLGHKEWRFIVYIVPWFNLIAAVGWQSLSHRKQLLRNLIVGSFIIASFASSALMAYISSHNYPGGAALSELHNVLHNNKQFYSNVSVHLDTYTSQTGASLFGQLSPTVSYTRLETAKAPEDPNDPTEHEYLDKVYFGQFDYIVTSTPNDKSHEEFEIVSWVNGLSGIKAHFGQLKRWGSLKRRLVESYSRWKCTIEKVWRKDLNHCDEETPKTVLDLFAIEVKTDKKIAIMRKKIARTV